MKEETEQAKKIDSIEQTVAKSNIRNNINKQFEEYLYKNKKHPDVINIASLSAKEWFFEYGLLNSIKHSLVLKNPPKLQFISAEHSKKIAEKAYVNMPDNATIIHGLFSDIFKSPFATSKAGFSYLTEKKDGCHNTTQYGLVWADYCSYANTELLKDFVYVAENNVSSGLIYLTFCISKKHGADANCLKDLNKYSNGKDIHEVTLKSIDHFSKKIKGKKVRKIFEVVYGGGSTLGTSMITVGFSVNVPSETITPMRFNDSEWKSPNRYKRQCTLFRLKRHGGWTVKKQGRKLKKYRPNPETIARRKATKEQKMAWDKLRKKILIRFDRGWSTERIYKDLASKLKPLGRTVQSVSSVIAWRSPALAKKVRNKA